jgi:hypothetical protein
MIDKRELRVLPYVKITYEVLSIYESCQVSMLSAPISVRQAPECYVSYECYSARVSVSGTRSAT